MSFFKSVLGVAKDIGGVISDIGGVASAFGAYKGGKDQQDSSQEFAREQMAFQERMSNSAHQREVADLKAAGLNPILSTKHGGASSPSGAMGTAVNALGDAAKSGVTTAMAARRLDAEIDQIHASTDQTKQLTKQSEATTLKELEAAANTAVDTGLKNEVINHTREQRLKTVEDTALSRESQHLSRRQQDAQKAQTDILTESLQSAKAAAARDKEAEAFYRTPLGQALFRLGLAGKTLNPFNEAITSGRNAVNLGGGK